MNRKQARKMRQYIRKELHRTLLGWLHLPWGERARIAWRLVTSRQMR